MTEFSKWYTPAMKAFLNGYEPVLADEMVADKRAKAGKGTSERMSDQRATGQPLTGWGNGTIVNLTDKADQDMNRRAWNTPGLRGGAIQRPAATPPPSPLPAAPGKAAKRVRKAA